MRCLLTIAYKGTNYAGWQRQENANTVQEEIEKALSKLYKEPAAVLGASRTDAGVHALGQKCVFTAPADCIPMNKLPFALNSYLPVDISVTEAKEVSNEFHPIFDAKAKTYIYKIYNGVFRNPLLDDTSWHIYRKLNTEHMNEAAAAFIGEYDFSAFCAAGGSAKTFVRRINYADVYTEENELICFEVNGNGFLYNMVRIIAGTLVYVGLGKIGKSAIADIIKSKDRKQAGITAPPQGLCLKEVYY